jgi:hypothetical protein
VEVEAVSIVTVYMYTVVCDGCGVDSNEVSDYSCWSDPQSALETARDIDWLLTDDGTHWCSDCTEFDQDENRRPTKEARRRAAGTGR